MIHQFTTENGLKVIGIESHKSPVVSVQIWTRNGSADERNGDEGLSHFIEHLVFKGTKTYVAGEIAARVEACGGEINAYTSFDQTVYYITISKEFYAEALKIIAEMVSSPRFDPIEVDREREVVIEEIKRSHDSLGRRASRLLFSNYYVGHPYAVPVIGYEKNIREVSVERLKNFFADRYVVDNMFLVVTGDFVASDLGISVEKYFSEVSQKPPQKPKREEPESLTGQKVFVEEAPFEEAVFYLAWPGVKVDHADLAALECLMLIFGQGASSRLYRSLRLQKDLVNSIGAGLWAPSQAAGFLSVSGSLNVDKMEPALIEVRAQIEALLRDGVSEQEVQKAKTNFLAEEAYILETVGGLARKYGGNYEATEDLFYHEKFHDQLAKVDANMVLQIARKYFRSENQLAVAIVPRDKIKTEKFLKQMSWGPHSYNLPETSKAAEGSKREESRATRSTAQQIETKRLTSNLKTFYSKNQEAPVYNLRLAILGGSRVVPAEKAGLAELAGRVWSTKTKKNTEGQIREQCDSLASSLYSYSGRNTMGLVVDGLTEHQQSMAELFSDALEQFIIDEAIVTREKNAILESLRSRKDSPSSVASLWFQKMLFAGHPYAQDPMGSTETVTALKGKDVEDYLQSFLSSDSAVAALSGDFDSQVWQNALLKLPSRPVADALAKPITPPAVLTEDLYHFEKLEKEQTHIIYGVHGLSLNDPDRYTLQVLEAVLSGQGGRLFIELRDKASLAYSVSPLRMEGLGTGYFATYIGCSPEKADTAIQMMKEEWHKMAEFKISEEELSRAQNYLVGGHDIGLQKNSSIASSIAFNEIYGNSYRELTEFARHVRGVDAERVQQLAQRLFSQRAALSVVGPQEPKHRPKKSFS